MFTTTNILWCIYSFSVLFSLHLSRHFFAMEYKRVSFYRTTPSYLLYVVSCFIPLLNLFNAIWDYTEEKKLYCKLYPNHLTFLDRFVRILLVPHK